VLQGKLKQLYGVFISNFAALITENGNKKNLVGTELGKTPSLIREVQYFSNHGSKAEINLGQR
jgi:hypothetical protein